MVKHINNKDGFLEKIKFKNIGRYIGFLVLMVGGYELIENCILSNRVDKLQGKVDNLYKQVNEMKNGNKALEKK